MASNLCLISLQPLPPPSLMPFSYMQASILTKMDGSTMCSFHACTLDATEGSRHPVSTSHPARHTSLPKSCSRQQHQSHHYLTRPRPFSTTSSILTLLLLATVSVTATSAQQTCTDNAGCYPPVGNLALGRTVLVNSTCMAGRQFCPFFLSSDCDFCSDSAHSLASLNDNDNSTFWVSEIGTNVREVALRLDFEAPMFFQGMTLVWKSVRPIAMTLERSCDNGETWSVYRYYALNCAVAFMMDDTFVGAGVGPFSGTTPICTSTQTELFSFGFTDAVVSYSYG